LPDPEAAILEDVANPDVTRDDVATAYALGLLSEGAVNWPTVNAAIIERWSTSGLEYVKRIAWRKITKEEGT
jgi:hypothetical protein